MNILCFLNIHKYRHFFVGSSWNPDIFIRACARCGRERL